jgi:C4-type Zn-finger protein
MKIKNIISRSRRDFRADMECESCGNIQKLTSGYDDANYHENVIPAMKCQSCGKASNAQTSSATIPAGVVL